MELLAGRKWFRETSPELIAELSALPATGRENHDGFLEDLAARPETMGGITVIRLLRIARGNFALIPIFEVQDGEGRTYTYEYVSWRYGPLSGAKGIVFVKDYAGEITHFIVLRGDKFATGEKEWDLVGGFIDLDVDGVTTIMDRIQVELCEELGVPKLKVMEVINLGDVLVDAGMTNNRPRLFAAMIDASEASKTSNEEINLDWRELKSGPIVVPISQFCEYMANTTDGYFKMAAACVVARGIVSI